MKLLVHYIRFFGWIIFGFSAVSLADAILLAHEYARCPEWMRSTLVKHLGVWGLAGICFSSAAVLIVTRCCNRMNPNDKVSDGCRPRAHDGTQNV